MTRASNIQKDLVFIVSGGRTGTTFFGQQISQIIPEAFSVHEPDLLYPDDLTRNIRAIREFGLWHMIFGRLLGRTGIRALSTKRICDPDVDGIEIQNAIRRHRDAYFTRQPESLIVESNGQWFGLLDDIREVYPNAKIAGVVRDPRDWVRSWIDYGGRHDATDIAAKIGVGRISPKMANEPIYDEHWNSAAVFDRLCWDWRLVNFRIADFAGRDPRTRLFRFEDLFGANSDAGMVEFLDFVAEHRGRRYQYEKPENFGKTQINASTKKTHKWQDWPQQDAQQLEKFCQPLMSRLNYGEEEEWRALVGD